MNEEQKQGLEYFKGRLPIDEFRLERECREHSSLLDEVGTWVSYVKADAKIKKRRIDFVTSRLSLKIRRDPKAHGLEEKPKEGAITSMITIDEDYQQAVADSIEADRTAFDASTLLSSMEDRGSRLRDLVKLYISNYYSSSDNVVNRESWEKSEAAIIALRNSDNQEELKPEKEMVSEE